MMKGSPSAKFFLRYLCRIRLAFVTRSTVSVFNAINSSYTSTITTITPNAYFVTSLVLDSQRIHSNKCFANGVLKIQFQNITPEKVSNMNHKTPSADKLRIFFFFLMEVIPLCDIIQSYTNIYVNTHKVALK